MSQGSVCTLCDGRNLLENCQKLLENSWNLSGKNDWPPCVRKSLLYCNNKLWVKKGESNFDATMGAYDGAEVYELIGIFLLSLLSKHINKNYIGLYKDDGFPIIKNTNSRKKEERSRHYCSM